MDPKKSKLENLQKELYSKNFKKRDDSFELPSKEYNIENSWKRQEIETRSINSKPKKNRTSTIYFILLISALVFFIGSVLYAGFIFFRDNKIDAGEDISINIIGPVSIGGGEKLSLDVIVQNNNSIPLELVDLVVEFPNGAKDAVDSITEVKRLREDLGEIAPGAVVRKTVNAVLFGEENSVQDIKFSIEYHVQDSNAIFQKKKDFSIVLNASPVRLTVESLREISSGQQIELDLKISSNSSKKLENVIIEANYPFGFIYENSDIKPTKGDNVWVFDSLEPEEEKNIKIIGTIEGQNEEERFFRFNSGLAKEDSPQEIGIVFNTTSHSTIIKKSFVDLDLIIDNQQRENGEVYVQSGERNTGIIKFTNNTNSTIRDLNIQLSIDGPALDEKTVIVEQGFYNSIDNLIFWDSGTDDLFSEIPPRKNITLRFSFETYPLNNEGLTLKNPEIKLDAVVNGNRVSEELSEEKINTSQIAIVKVLSDVAINTYTEYEDGPFENTGPVPPKAEESTSYTVVLDLTNSTNDLSDAKIEATIPSYVSWNNKISPISEKVSFDENRRKIVWDIGNIYAGSGYYRNSEKLFINLILTPSVSQIKEIPDLLRNIKFTAVDTFTKSIISQEVKKVPTTFIEGHSIIDKHQNVVE